MRRYLAVVLLGTGIISIPNIASAAEQAASTDDCDKLISTLDQQKSESLPVTMEQARAYKTAGNVQACRQANDQIQAAAGAGQPPADQQASTGSGKVLVQQPAPKVSIEQAPAEVTVTQGQPQIMIHQPAPTITVDIPPAEVVVRMPQPQVAVQQQKPQVQVEQAKPEVAVNEQGKEQAKVQMEGNGQPAVDYKADEPKVVINKPKEPPKIKFEQMASSDATGDQGNKPADQATGQAGKQASTGGDDGMVKLRVADIKQMPIVNDRGENLGTVEAVTVKSGTRDGYVVIRAGQFLGIGDKTVAVPFSNLWVRGNQLVITGLTNEQVGGLTEWKSGDTNFQQLGDDQVAEIKNAA